MDSSTNSSTYDLSEEIIRIRNKAILTLMAEYGLDLGQVMEITLRDIDVNQKILAVKPGMAAGTGFFILSSHTATALAHYLRVRSPSKENKLFLSEDGSEENRSLTSAIERQIFS